MAKQATTRPQFSWASALGISVILFMVYGVYIFYIAVKWLAPIDTASLMNLVQISKEADSAILGQVPSAALSNPNLLAYVAREIFTLQMANMMYAILQIAVPFFALRRGQLWALWSSSFAVLSFIPYLIAMTFFYSKFGIDGWDIWWSDRGFWIVSLIIGVTATLLGWYGIQPYLKSKRQDV